MPARIERLTLKNFKSFRSANIPFAPGFTAIMGPNGAGKSNIVDAIVFVLGEGRLKTIRASRLKDLVHHNARDGTAVVTIDLVDGEKRYTITRMIDRKGRSVYRINGKRAMRHEVLSLLSSLGISPNGYNIVLQGEITRLFNMSPLERRRIIDEVAGIAEFEERKQEALKQLEDVEGRIEDALLVLGERKAVLEKLKKERDAALEYMELKRRLKGLRRYMLERKKSETEGEIERLEKEKEKLASRLQDLRKKLSMLEEERKRLEEEKNVIEKKILELMGTSGGVDALRAELEKTREFLNLAKAEREEILDRISKLVLRKEKMERTLETLEAEMRDVRERLREKRGKLEEVSSELSRVLETLRREEGERKGIEQRILEIEEEISRLKEEFSKLKEEHSRIEGEYNALLEEEEKRRKKREERRKMVEELRKLLEKLVAEKDQLLEKEKALNREYIQLSDRANALREELGAYRGISRALRSMGIGLDVLDELLRAQERGELRGIHGFVAQLIRYEKKYTSAIEAAAGRRLFYIVVDTAEDAANAIKYLRRTGKGRATFIPLDRIRGNVVSPPNEPGVLGNLLDFVSFDERYRRAMEYVFGDAILTENIDVAKRYAGKLRAVTLDGDVVERSGTMSGGAKHTSGVLDVIRAEELKKELADAESRLKAITGELYKIRDRLAYLAGRISEIKAKLDTLSEEEESKDLSAYSSRLEELEKRMNELVSRISDLEMEKAKLREKLKGSEGRERIERVSELQEEQNLLSREVAELEALLRAKETERKNVKRALDEVKEEIDALARKREEMEKRIEELSAKVSELQTKLVEVERELAERRAEIEELRAKRDQIDERINRLDEERGRISTEINELTSQLSALESKLFKLRYVLEDIAHELADYADVEPVSSTNPQREIEEISARMQALEPVNMRAIDEYEEQKRKVEEIEQKVEKLREEKASVLRLLEEIEQKKKKAFFDTFIHISNLFSRLFRELLGGEGRLKLTDEEDVFNAGLIIEAKPKGKPLKNLDAMSGGEKALTALAFLFAIAMYRPAGFYILDEPDLMLDKPNAERMAKFIKKLSKDAQFIVISHRDPVLKEADQIIGVFMREDGSSVIEIRTQEAFGTARAVSATS